MRSHLSRVNKDILDNKSFAKIINKEDPNELSMSVIDELEEEKYEAMVKGRKQ